MAPDYIFRPMTAADLPLIRRWLALPHVREWWGDRKNNIPWSAVTSMIEAMEHHRLSGPASPLFGYLQCYDPDRLR